MNVLTSATISKTICFNESYDFIDTTYSVSGTYYGTTSNVAGCDSTVTLVLTVLPADTIHISKNICEGDSYDFYGRDLTSSGTYYDTIPNATGCDSIAKLVLTVHPPDMTRISESVCEGDIYFFSGKSLETTEAGIYEHDTTLQSIHGCDSTVILTLTVNPVYSFSFIDTICEGDSYYFCGEYLTAAGPHSRTLSTINGCDSTLNLQLTMILTEFSIFPPDEICADALSFCVPVDLRGTKMIYYNVQFDPTAQEQKFENFNTTITDRDCFEIKIPNNPNDRRDYVMPNNYMAYISVNDDKCTSSTLELPFQILYPGWIFEQKWNNVLAVLNDRYNGGYFFSNYEWFLNGSLLSATGSYIYMPLDFTPGAEYRVRLTRVGETAAFFSCPLFPEYRSSNKVYPQLIAKNETINVETQQDGIVVVWNVFGSKLAQYPVFENQINKIPLNVTGFLLLEVIQNDGHRQVFKIIVN